MSMTFVPFYPSDWLAGTRGLSAEETGVYITLVARIYEMAGPIERDDARLSRLCGCKTKPSFVRALEYLISEGKIVEIDGCITNERAEKEIKNATEKSEKARQAAQSRWGKKPNKNNVVDNADASTKHMPQPCQPEPEPKREDTNVSLSRRAKPQRFQEFWDAYPHRNGAKKGRSKAEAKFALAVRHGVSEQDIIDAAIRYGSDRQVLEGYAKNPETWLNQRGWEDEIEPSSPGPSGGERERGGAHDSLFAGFARFAGSDGGEGGFDSGGGETSFGASDEGVDCGQGGDSSKPVLRIVGS